MNEFSTQSELLMRYLDEGLQGKEKENFEQMLAESNALRAEMENLRSLRTVIQRYGLEQQVAGIRAEMREETEKQPGILRMMLKNTLKIAAVAILFLGIIAFYEYVTLTPSALFDSHFIAYAPPVSRGTADSSAIAHDYLENKDEELVALYRSRNIHTEEEDLLAGNAYLRMNNYGAATGCFLSILNTNRQTGTHRFEEDAEYYLALGYLANKEVDKALPLFEKINAEKSHAYHDRVDNWFIRRMKWLH